MSFSGIHHRSIIASVALAVLTVAASGKSAAASRSEAGREVRLRTQAEADSVTAGQRLHIRYTATYADSLTLLPPSEFDVGNCRFVSIRWSERSQDGLRVKQADLTVLPVDLEYARVPGLPFSFLDSAGDTLIAWGDDVEVPIRALTTDESTPQPQKPQWEAPPSFRWLWIALLAVALTALAIFLWRRRKKPEPAVPVEPELPPDYVALKALGEIEQMGLLQQGEFKRYYSLIVDVVRQYLERRYHIHVMDRTTEEILYDLNVRDLAPDGLAALLEEADLVKFAKYRPEIASARTKIEAARDIIVRTTPRPAVAGE